MSDIFVSVVNQRSIRASTNSVVNGSAVSVRVDQGAIRVAASLSPLLTASIASLYDLNANGIVDNAEQLGGQPPSFYALASRTINGQALTSDVTLASSDFSYDAAAITFTPAASTDWTGSTDPGNVDNALDQLALRLGAVEAGGGSDASTVTYTPAASTDWSSDADPGNVDGALDQLASRMIAVEGATGGGGRTLIAEVAPTTDATSVTFDSIPDTYKKLVVEFAIRFSGDSGGNPGADGLVKFNNNSTAGNYDWHSMYVGTADSSLAYTGGSGSGNYFAYGILANSNAAANEFTIGTMEIIQYANTGFFKKAHTTMMYQSPNIYLTLAREETVVSFKITTAISRIDFLRGAVGDGTFEAGSVFRLYGEN